MIRTAVLVLGSVILLGLVGCASKPSMAVREGDARGATTQPIGAEGKAAIRLEAMEPKLALPKPQPVASTSSAPSLDALELYAKARAQLEQGQRFAGIGFLKQALERDPDRFALLYELGEAYTGNGAHNPDAIAAFERAAAINPDHLRVQTELGRQLLNKGETDKAIERLRLALLTRDYNRDGYTSALAEYLLAKALQEKGYDTASLEVYDRLLARVPNLTLSRRANPEIMQILARPEVLFVRVAELYAKHDQHDEALRAYQFAADQEPGNLGYQTKVVRTLLALRRTGEARDRAADIVERFRASDPSIRLLREAYAQDGGDQAVATELAKLHEANPRDVGVLFALTDVLNDLGRAKQVEVLLRRAIEQSDYDPTIVTRLYDHYSSQNRTDEAARLLTIALAERPDALRDLAGLMNELLRPSRSNRVRLPDLEALDVPDDAEAAKLFWISRVAELWNRGLLARASLDHAVKLDPPFPPAYRALLNDQWQRADWDEARKVAESQALIARAREAGDEALAAELEGLLALNQDQPEQAISKFQSAETHGGSPRDVRLSRAMALLAAERSAQAEQLLWQLVTDFPTFEEAYATLFRYYLDRQAIPQSLRVLQSWLAADPANVNAKLIEASFYIRARQYATAEGILLALLESDGDQADVLVALQAVYQQTGRLQQFIERLETERVEHPENRTALEQLIGIYVAQNRTTEASEVLDQARDAVSDDPDLLYYVAHLYTRIGQNETMEQTLGRVLEIDPSHAPAANDLGYNWADDGRNLDEAERLIRIAVRAEPDNESFLDSLGWVLYKRGKFAEALKYIQEAIEPATYPDPVVLDHLGDVLYRLGRLDEAEAQWKRSQQRLVETGATREDLRELNLQLDKKLAQLEAGQEVNVAPIAESTDVSGQARKPQPTN